MTSIDNAKEAATYGSLVRVAINFYLSTRNPAELDAAICYTRAAAYWADRAIRNIEWNPPASTCIENLADADPLRLSYQIRVF